MGLGRLRGSKPPPEITGSHETKGEKMNPFILKRFTTPTLVVADNEILFVPLILLFHLQFCACGKNGHLKTLGSTVISTDPHLALPPQCTLPPMHWIRWLLLSKDHSWDKKGGRACMPFQPVCCWWSMLLNTTWAAWGEGLSCRILRSAFHAPLPELSSCTDTLLLFHLRLNRHWCYKARLKPDLAVSNSQWGGWLMGDGRSAT